MKKKNNNKGITLIALVITIIVLLILAGVSIAMLTGQNGILTQASNARLETEYSNITDSISLAVTEYNMLKQTDETVAGTSFIDWLKDKRYINDNNEIQVANLLGQTMSTGNGTGTSDVYKIEEVTETAKIASTIKVAATETEKEYKIVYYDKEGNPTELKTFTLSTPEELEETDPKLFEVEDGVISIKDYDAYYDGSRQWTIENVVIPSEVDGQKVTSIKGSFFFRAGNSVLHKVKSIVVPEGVKTLESSAFAYVHGLEYIQLPSTLETIGYRALAECENLKSIIIPGKVARIEDHALDRCSLLENVIIEEGVKEIGSNVFYFCEELKSITIPESVTTIEDQAFKYCRGIKEIFIPSTVTTMGRDVFSGWTEEQKIHVPFASTDGRPDGWESRWNTDCHAQIVYTDSE